MKTNVRSTPPRVQTYRNHVTSSWQTKHIFQSLTENSSRDVGIHMLV